MSEPGEPLAAAGHCAFGLIVTGAGEAAFLPEFFRSLTASASCHFRVLQRIGQRGPITSAPRKLRMVGAGQVIPTEDEREIGLPARRFLRGKPGHFVLLVDDLEHPRRPVIGQVFRRYRSAMDTMLEPAEQRRAAIHLLANMLEAYYLAHSEAVNIVFGAPVLTRDHPGDVEDIPHPKHELKRLFPDFDELQHGARIVAALDLRHVLANPGTCAHLRSLFAWCVRQLLEHGDVYERDNLARSYQIPSGIRAQLTDGQ